MGVVENNVVIADVDLSGNKAEANMTKPVIF
jgi:hypothetical protein